MDANSRALGLGAAAVPRALRPRPARTPASSAPPIPVALASGTAVTSVDPAVAEFQEYWQTVLGENRKTEERIKEQAADFQQEQAKGGASTHGAHRLLKVGQEAEEEMVARARAFTPRTARVREVNARYIAFHSKQVEKFRRVNDLRYRSDKQAELQRELADLQRAAEWPEFKELQTTLEEVRRQSTAPR